MVSSTFSKIGYFVMFLGAAAIGCGGAGESGETMEPQLEAPAFYAHGKQLARSQPGPGPVQHIAAITVVDGQAELAAEATTAPGLEEELEAVDEGDGDALSGLE